MAIVLFGMLIATPLTVSADVAVGDVVVSVGEDLTQEQKESVLNELDVSGDYMEVVTTNDEEHQYLGDYIPAAQIGSKALSSAKITYTKSGSGLEVDSSKITWVSDEMYMNALATAGVKDARIEVTAPFQVSGTAALTGIIKAYETSSGEKISEDVKQTANEEMVMTAELGDELGTEEAGAFMTAMKEKLAENTPENAEEMKQLVQQTADDLGIQLDQQTKDELTQLFTRMQDLNIDFNAVGDQLEEAKQKFDDFINSEEGKNFIQQIGDFVMAVLQAIADFFRSIFS
ncbi:DUF1002 domain-containing protein [Pontibacillus halophilus]|nr:DUF1002 domain-containing protein [Pontibacillus halophilus]